MAYISNANAIIQDFIIHKIQMGEWKAGDRIWAEQEICQHLDVSRVAVREAISALCGMNVLVKKQGSGTYVLSADKRTLLGQQLFEMTPQEVVWLMELRAFFDEHCVRLFMERASEEDVQQLEDAYYQMIRHLDHPKKFNHYANEFHNIIASGTQNPFIIRIGEFLSGYLHKHQEVLQASTGKDIGTIYHYKILSAIKQKNIDFAALYMRYHIQLGIERFQQSICQCENKLLDGNRKYI